MLFGFDLFVFIVNNAFQRTRLGCLFGEGHPSPPGWRREGVLPTSKTASIFLLLLLSNLSRGLISGRSRERGESARVAQDRLPPGGWESLGPFPSPEGGGQHP